MPEKFEQFTPEEQVRIQSERTLSDAEKIKDSAQNVLDEGAEEPRLEFTEKQVEEARQEMSRELKDFENNLTTVEQATGEFSGAQEIAGLAKKLTSEQRQLIEGEIRQLQDDIERHKYSAGAGLMAINPWTTLMQVMETENSDKLAPFLGYISGGIPIIGLEEAIRNGVNILRDKYRLGKVKKEKRKLERS